MKRLDVLLRSCWHEFRAGAGNGIVSFTFIGLTAYLALSLTSAEYMQTLGATDVPRNGASVIYLMVTGFMFFLFFAWAWIFAQPILRDRSASLHEAVLTTPVNLKILLLGRFLGACLLGMLLGSSVLFGFFVAPLLETVGWMPAGSFSSPPWAQFGFSLVWLIIPTTIGIGAIYLIAAILTRNIAGPLIAAVIIILIWMFAAVTLTEGDVNLTLASILDPSLFSFALAETDLWSPQQKESAFLPIGSSFLTNRLIWTVLPVCALILMLSRISRERLVSIPDKAKPSANATRRIQNLAMSRAASRSKPSQNWARTFVLECRWLIVQVFQSRALWLGVIVLFFVGLSNTFIHIIWHAEGPLQPDPDTMVKELNTSLYLVFIFILAGLVGIISRRDIVPGIDEMFDSLTTPTSLRLSARAVTIVGMVFFLTLVPALSAIISTLIVDRSYLDLAFIFTSQIVIVAPALLEGAMIIFLIHALIRRTGLAYGASMFVVLVLILNHELGLTDYPPFEIGVPARIAYSPLSGWEPWLNYSFVLGAFKWALALFLVGIAALVLPRGRDSRLRKGGVQIRRRLIASPGGVAFASLLAVAGTLWILNGQLIERGGYQTAQTIRAENALWETQWAQPEQDISYSVGGGDLSVVIDASQQKVTGIWALSEVVAPGGVLYASAPENIADVTASVNARAVVVDHKNDLLKLPLGACAKSGCEINLSWSVKAQGWPTAAEAPLMTSKGVWARASQVAPTLGLDPNRVLRADEHRQKHDLASPYPLPQSNGTPVVDGIAPAANWSWQIAFDQGQQPYDLRGPLSGTTNGPLTFSIFGGANVQSHAFHGVSIHSAIGDQKVAELIALDASEMQQCVARRLDTSVDVQHIVRWPKGRGESALPGTVLILAESPHWHVQNDGVGHLMRRANIARLIARQHMLERTGLRQEPGSLWISEGISGAIGFLCVGDTDGLGALSRLLERFSEETTKELAASSVPVGPLSDALSDGWATYYAPQAALAWVAGQSPDELNAVLSKLSADQPIEVVIADLFGEDTARMIVGPPRLSTLRFNNEAGQFNLSGQRQTWANGAWAPVDEPLKFRALISGQDGITLSEELSSRFIPANYHNQQMLIIDDGFSYLSGATVLPAMVNHQASNPESKNEVKH